MTNDDRNQERLSAFFDGEVSDVERAAVEDLLKSSPAATDVLNDYRALSGMLRELPRNELGDEFTSTVLRCSLNNASESAPSQHLSRRDSRTGRLRGLLATACTVATLVALVAMLELRRPDEVSPQNISNTSNNELAHTESTTLPTDENAIDQRFADQFDKKRQLKNQASTEPGMNLAERLPTKPGRTQQPGSRQFRMLSGGKTHTLSGAARPSLTERAGQTPAEPLVPPIPLSPGGSTHVGNAESSSLVFIDNLQKLSDADVGRVVTAFERTKTGVAVVKLTVIEYNRGLDELQVLLSRNAIQKQPDRLEIDAHRKSKNRVVAVYVQATSDQLSSALSGLKDARFFQSLKVEPSIPLAMLELDADRSTGPNPFSFQSKRHREPTTKPPQAEFGRDRTSGAKQPPRRRNAIQSASKRNADSAELKKAEPQPRHVKPTAELAEMERISRHLSLSLSRPLLKELRAASVAQIGSQRPFADGRSSRPVTARGKQSEPRKLQVLFVIEQCR